jgi:hypothetical protein
MERHGVALTLSQVHCDGWRAAFYANPMLSAAGFEMAPTPWQAVQRAAWAALSLRRLAGC